MCTSNICSNVCSGMPRRKLQVLFITPACFEVPIKTLTNQITSDSRAYSSRYRNQLPVLTSTTHVRGEVPGSPVPPHMSNPHGCRIVTLGAHNTTTTLLLYYQEVLLLFFFLQGVQRKQAGICFELFFFQL